jgi:hypothetical protein
MSYATGVGSTASDIAAITGALTQAGTQIASSVISAQQGQQQYGTPGTTTGLTTPVYTPGIDPSTGLPYGTSAPSTDYTVPLVIGGIAVAGLVGFMLMRRKPTPNRRKHADKRRPVSRNATRRSSGTRPKSPKFSELGVWEAVARVRETGQPSEMAGVLPPGIAAKFRKLAPGLYKYGFGPKKGEVIVQFKKASLKGALTSTRIGASKAGEYHWVVDNFDPKFPVVIRGIDNHGHSYFRVEEYAKKFAKVPVYAIKKGMATNSRTQARRSSNKEIDELVQKARHQGWTVMHGGGGHLIFRSPDKSVPQVVVPSTPGGGNRGVDNARSRLKRSGLVLNRRQARCAAPVS